MNINSHLLKWLVGPSGLEPPTSCLSGTRSNLLSYEPMQFRAVFHFTLEYLASFAFQLTLVWLSGLPDRLRGLPRWWRWWDSNPWPPACRAGALPAELHPRIFFPTVLWKNLFLSLFLFLKSRVTTPLLSVSIELSSRTVARKVFSPLQSLTSVFGMGTGGPSAFVTLTINFSQGSILENWTPLVPMTCRSVSLVNKS